MEGGDNERREEGKKGRQHVVRRRKEKKMEKSKGFVQTFTNFEKTMLPSVVS